MSVLTWAQSSHSLALTWGRLRYTFSVPTREPMSVLTWAPTSHSLALTVRHLTFVGADLSAAVGVT